MSYNIDKIFSDLAHMSKVHTKSEYEEMTKEFKDNRYAELSDLVSAADCSSESTKFCQDVLENYKKLGKIRSVDQMNLNYFMIYFVFPTILTKEENGKEICDTLRDTWNSQFKCTIDYTDYDTLYENFHTKIFGIPIGK